MVLKFDLCCRITNTFIQKKCWHEKVKNVLNKAQTLQNITFFSKKSLAKNFGKLRDRDRNVINHWVNCAAKLESHWIKKSIFQGWQVICHSWKIDVWQLCIVKFGCGTDPTFFLQFCKILKKKKKLRLDFPPNFYYQFVPNYHWKYKTAWKKSKC